VIFCLATTEPEKLPITILSRCQRFDLHRIATNLIAQQLHSIATKEKLTLAAAAAHAIARGAEGGMRDAESMLDQLVAFCGELIDQFAAAEGRMKWAPNKKLHFEVAVIRAIQTLDQTTLDEVIENLNALRDGNPVAPPLKRPGGDPVAAVVDRGPGVSDAGYK